MTDERYRIPYDFGVGGVSIGNEFHFTTDDQAQATLSAAWDAGIRYYDVSPWYGLGLAERRYGRFLSNRSRDSFVVSSKVGKLLKASRDNEAKRYYPFTTSPNTPYFDYTAEGVRRSIEDSLQRMGLDRLDVVFVHDLSPDNDLLPDDWEALFKIAQDGAFPELTRMREEGLIDAWGMGVNCPDPILRCMEVADSDIHLLASQYSLLDHDHAVEAVFPVAHEKGQSFVVGTALNAGFLGGAARYNYGDANAVVPRDKADKRSRFASLAAEHGVDLLAAALQFSRAPDVAGALIVGAATPEHILADHAALHATIPATFWSDAKDQGLIHRDAPIPD